MFDTNEQIEIALLSGLSGFFSLFVIAVVIIFKKKQFGYLKRIELMRARHEKILLAARLRIQELTLQVISREIHDNIQNKLTVSKAQLDNIKLHVDKKSSRIIETSSELIGETIDSLNVISKVLDSDIIKNLGLLQALSTEINRINMSGLFTISLNVLGTIQKIHPEKELSIFRIAQEAFSNVIKHSKAKVVDLSLDYTPSHLELTIYDNGNGFDCSQDQKLIRRSGLNNIKVRAQMMKGQANVQSSPGKGTSIWVSIPYDDNSTNAQTFQHGIYL